MNKKADGPGVVVLPARRYPLNRHGTLTVSGTAGATARVASTNVLPVRTASGRASVMLRTFASAAFKSSSRAFRMGSALTSAARAAVMHSTTMLSTAAFWFSCTTPRTFSMNRAITASHGMLMVGVNTSSGFFVTVPASRIVRVSSTLYEPGATGPAALVSLLTTALRAARRMASMRETP